MTGVSTPSGPPGTSGARVLLDGAAAPMVPAAREVLVAALDAGWADPRRLYAEGRQARRLLDDAREAVASGLGVRPPEVSFLPRQPPTDKQGDHQAVACRRRLPLGKGEVPR